MAGQRQTTPEQEAFIRQHAMAGRNATQIHTLLETEGLRSGDHPDISLRLVQERVREYKMDTGQTDTSGPWSALDTEPAARLVLDVAAYVTDATDGRAWLTKEMALWVAKVRKVSPEIPPAWAHTMARAYRTLSMQPEPRDTRPLDVVLAAKPWESPERAYWYKALIYRAEKAIGRQPQGLEIDIRALLDMRPGGPLGSLGAPWTPQMTEDQYKDFLRDHQRRELESLETARRRRRTAGTSTPTSTPKPVDSHGQK